MSLIIPRTADIFLLFTDEGVGKGQQCGTRKGRGAWVPKTRQGGDSPAAERPAHEPRGLRRAWQTRTRWSLLGGGGEFYPKKGYTWVATPGGEGWVGKAGLPVHRRQERRGIGDAGPQTLPLWCLSSGIVPVEATGAGSLCALAVEEAQTCPVTSPLPEGLLTTEARVTVTGPGSSPGPRHLRLGQSAEAWAHWDVRRETCSFGSWPLCL